MYYFDDEFKQHFLDKLQNLVVSGESISHHKSLESETVVKNSDGEIIRTMNTVKNERNTTMLPTPSWVMQMIDRNLSLEQSIKNCQNAGYLVLDPNEVPDENNKPKGISDETVELIKTRLLGFSSLEESQEALEKHGGSYGTYERNGNL